MKKSRPNNETLVCVTGAGGFIGYHLVRRLKSMGFKVRGIDLKYPEFGESDADDFRIADLRDPSVCRDSMAGVHEVFALAADMGGMGYISENNAHILHSNSLINLNTIQAAHENGVARYIYASSACVYPEFLQTESDIAPLREEDAFPAQPQDAYGWEKLVSERLCHHYLEDYGLETTSVRFHNIFGPQGTWEGGREKAPAAMCRKVATAKFRGEDEIEIWGDGEQTRSFCFIDDCVEGLMRLRESSFRGAINLGQDRMISIKELAFMVADIAGIRIRLKHIDGPEGVRGRNSDNSLLSEILGWSPEVSLEDGLARTYSWIEQEVKAGLESAPA